MCCSISPGVPVRFSDTVLYAAEVIGPADEPVHVLGYQNKVQNGAGPSPMTGSALPVGPSGNAMILPFPAAPETMTRANVLDTKKCRNILQDMAAAVAPALRGVSRGGLPPPRSAPPPRIQVFPAAGIYTVVLAQDPRDIPAALDQVPRTKRPALNPALFEAYAAWYPGWTVALCCFNNRRARLAAPMLWWYRPMHADRLFLPAVDCHTGDIPDLDSLVPVDHVIAIGSHQMTEGRPVKYHDAISAAIAPYLRRSVIGRRYAAMMPNGDFVCQLDDVRRGVFRPARSRPTDKPNGD